MPKFQCHIEGPVTMRLVKPRALGHVDEVLAAGVGAGRGPGDPRAYIDPVTGLKNIDALVAELELNDAPVLFVLNLSGLAQINGIFGYHGGNAVIQAVARMLARYFAEEAFTLYKLPGGEFGLLTALEADAGCAITGRAIPWQRLREIGQQIVAEVGATIIHPDRWAGEAPAVPVRATATIGIAVGPVVGRDRLLSRAQVAVGAAKRRKQPVMFFRHAVRTEKEYAENLQWAERLHVALGEDRVVPYYQPILDNRTGKIAKYEVLARLIDEDGEVHPPSRFLPVANGVGLYRELTHAVVGHAFREAAALGVAVSVNLSSWDLSDFALAGWLEEEIILHGLEGRVGFEVLEWDAPQSYGVVSSFLKRFRALGCTYAIDDFGTGYSNFAHVIRLDVDTLKIDGSLIGHILDDANTRKVIVSIVNFARDIGLTTTAEFVAGRSIQEAVKALGIDYSQGYFLGEPKAKPL